ncbi:MAG: hypothetical protein V4478_01010 [Patescibacteria group bacterium]
MKKLWFKRKTYGWGWTPATAEGWLVLAIYMVSLLLILYVFRAYGLSSVLTTILFLTLSAGLIAVTAVTGEKPRWQWGNKGREDF